MNYSDKLSIQLAIGSKQYPLEIDRKDEELYRKAADLINNKIHRYISYFPSQEKEDYMAMPLIDITINLLKESNMNDKVKEMIDIIDKTLKLDNL